MHYVDKAIENLEKNPNKWDEDREPSVLEKLLKVDRHVAVVMALDMLLAGVDTVSNVWNLTSLTLRPKRFEIRISDIDIIDELFVLFGKEPGKAREIAERSTSNTS